jgi:DNA mismatch repair protein MutL
LFVELPPDWVDVNVHPTKREIRFRRPGDVRDAVIGAVRDGLAMTPDVIESEEADVGLPDMIGALQPEAPQTGSLKIDDLPPARTFKYPRSTKPQESVTGAMFDALAVNPESYENQVPDQEQAKQEEIADELHSAPWTWCRVIGQIGGFYVILETENGMVMMDPRAAHERVLYDRFMQSVIGGKVNVQQLLLPETIELPHRDAARVMRNLALFQHLGFGLSEFGGDSFVLDAIPSCMDGTPVKDLIVDMARALEEAGSRGGEHAREDAMAQAACRIAVGTCQKLSLDEIERLVVDLATCEMPYTSPRGRPTLIFTSLSELHKKFGRS